MYDTGFSYDNNLATNFLGSNMQMMMQGGQSTGSLLGQQFSNVMNSMTGTINRNAQYGILPGQNSSSMYGYGAGRQNYQYGNVNQNAPYRGQYGGQYGGQYRGQMTPQQIAYQMSIGGPLSVLPYIGGGAVTKMLFPVAGLWSMVDGVREYKSLKADMLNQPEQRSVDPNELSYQQSLKEMYEVSDRWSQMGPFGYDETY